MEKEYKLTFNYKGQRDYVQGPDILEIAINELRKDFEDISNIRYSAHNWIRNNAKMIISKSSLDINGDSVITFNSGSNEYIAYINDDKVPIIERNPYSEDIIVNKSIIIDKEIKFKNILDYSFSEIIVSMNKYFLQQYTKIPQKWIVTKIEYDRIIDKNEYLGKEIKLLLQSNLNNKLTRSLIFIEDNIVGKLYFTLI
jgi:hypothetical protein